MITYIIKIIYTRSEYHTQLAKMGFDEIFDLTAGVYFNLYNMHVPFFRVCMCDVLPSFFLPSDTNHWYTQ